MFKRPTLVSITAPTCAGKNYLAEVLFANGFNRLVSTTDRAPRAGEIEGVHYFFITTEQSKLKEQYDLFAELITYNGVRYGVTKEEMERKTAVGLPPPVVILEPQGVFEYRKYCQANGIDMFRIFIDTAESVRLARLAKRGAADVIAALKNVTFDHAPAEGEADAVALEAVANVMKVNNKRVMAIIEQERTWDTAHLWHSIVDGEDTDVALAQIKADIEYRNSHPFDFNA
jgi:guanylate kinase